ncbi:MAG: hypothetical protein L6V93_18705 [Clostridiales bacterium]|nr:MAG: hypothetical protein L6V93_18705 [Clostridiales bacterium]
MKKIFLSVILAFVLVFVGVRHGFFADNSYGTYTKISGKKSSVTATAILKPATNLR